MTLKLTRDRPFLVTRQVPPAPGTPGIFMFVLGSQISLFSCPTISPSRDEILRYTVLILCIFYKEVKDKDFKIMVFLLID